MRASQRARSMVREVRLTSQVSAGPVIVEVVWTPQFRGRPCFTWTKSGQLYWVPQVVASMAITASTAWIKRVLSRFIRRTGVAGI